MKLSIKLDGEDRSRHIGELEGDTLSVFRDRSKHLMRMYGHAYGINHDALKRHPEIKYIQIKDNEGVYKVPVKVFMEEGTIAQPRGFDEQVFLPLDIIEKYEKKEPKFKVGDKAWKPKGYKFPCVIVGVFQNTKGETRVVGEMNEYGLLHIFNEEQLEHYAAIPGLIKNN